MATGKILCLEVEDSDSLDLLLSSIDNKEKINNFFSLKELSTDDNVEAFSDQPPSSQINFKDWLNNTGSKTITDVTEQSREKLHVNHKQSCLSMPFLSTDDTDFLLSEFDEAEAENYSFRAISCDREFSVEEPNLHQTASLSCSNEAISLLKQLEEALDDSSFRGSVCNNEMSEVKEQRASSSSSVYQVTQHLDKTSTTVQKNLNNIEMNVIKKRDASTQTINCAIESTRLSVSNSKKRKRTLHLSLVVNGYSDSENETIVATPISSKRRKKITYRALLPKKSKTNLNN